MSIKTKINTQKILLAGLFIAIGVLGRVILHDFFAGITNPMPLDVFFVVSAVSLLAGVYLGRYYAFIVPVIIIALTDVFYAVIDPKTLSLWTSWLFLFTWSGFTIIALSGSLIKKKTIRQTKTFIPRLLGASVLGVFVYDVWTNFGFWLTFSKMGFYPQTIAGLGTVFVGGFPMMLWHQLSSCLAILCIILPLVYLKKQDILHRETTIRPIEKYIIIGSTAILLTASILTALV